MSSKAFALRQLGGEPRIDLGPRADRGLRLQVRRAVDGAEQPGRRRDAPRLTRPVGRDEDVDQQAKGLARNEPMPVQRLLDPGFDARMIIGDRALGLAQVPRGDEEGHKRRDALFELGLQVGETFLDLPQEPKRELVVRLQEAPQHRGRPDILAFLDPIDHSPLDRVLVRTPDCFRYQQRRVAAFVVIERRQGVKELLDFERGRQLRQHCAFSFLGDRLKLARQRVDARPVESALLRPAIMLGFQADPPGLYRLQRARALRHAQSGGRDDHPVGTRRREKLGQLIVPRPAPGVEVIPTHCGRTPFGRAWMQSRHPGDRRSRQLSTLVSRRMTFRPISEADIH